MWFGTWAVFAFFGCGMGLGASLVATKASTDQVLAVAFVCAVVGLVGLVVEGLRNREPFEG